jgi:aryl-alcohol dehydrogenase-like predicted oxidoreductase
MDYLTLAGTGATVSRICLGTMTFGGQADEAASIAMTHRALEGGVNFIDTADAYNQGATEPILGKALKGRRDAVVLASKVRWGIGDFSQKDVGLSRWHILRGVESSLKRLNTDCLDLLYLHSPDYDVPLEESLSAADQLVRDGKVMYVGMSNYAAWQVCQAKWICDSRGLHAPVVIQSVYNLLTRGIEQELLPFCRTLQVGVTVYNPLGGGLLTGKHNRTAAPADGTRFDLNKEYHGRYWRESNFDAVAEFIDIAKRAGKKPVQLALQWLAAQPEVGSIVIGASRMEQLEENLTAWEGSLDEETCTACDGVWERLRGESFAYNR